MTTPLPADSPHAKRLHQYLLNHPELSGGNLGLPAAAYEATPVRSIPRVSVAGSQAVKCWFNVDTAAKAGKGTAVFGWALWEASRPDECLAQPHAVLVTAAGELVCITPSEPDMAELEYITFFADPRIPFDYAGHRVPPMLALHTAGGSGAGVDFMWLGFHQERLDVPGAWSGPMRTPDNFTMCRMSWQNPADVC